MRIVVDINHPADYHYFKNFIDVMGRKGHDVLVTASEKDVSLRLLDKSGLAYVNLGSYGKSLAQKISNVLSMDLKMYRAVKVFDPDILLGLGSIRAAHASFLLRKKCIIFEDTEIASQQMILRVPFADTVWTPACFKGNIGAKQVRYDGYKELAYLRPEYFTPDVRVLDEIGQKAGDTIIVLRSVSWEATHDIGHHGMKDGMRLARELEKYGRVLVTSEAEPVPGLEKYRIDLPPDRIHHLLYYASLYLGEGATMATEAAILGTPAIYLSSIKEKLGNMVELNQKYGLLYCHDDQEQALARAIELVTTPGIKQAWRERRDRLLGDKIDVTAFMVWFVEHYPGSVDLIRKDPGLQYRLKA
ncbi:MAG TPA: DUF354 domain-containing protein [Methanocella sp.]|nr:DUF354 domain-containing protein [Methanocella sp.]